MSVRTHIVDSDRLRKRLQETSCCYITKRLVSNRKNVNDVSNNDNNINRNQYFKKNEN